MHYRARRASPRHGERRRKAAGAGRSGRAGGGGRRFRRLVARLALDIPVSHRNVLLQAADPAGLRPFIGNAPARFPACW